MAADDESKFNSSIKTSDYIREWCIEVGNMLMRKNDYTKANHLLWMLNNEIHGWYCKKNTVDKQFSELSKLEAKASEIASKLTTDSAYIVYGAILKRWARQAIQECYAIGWLAKENENIYDADEL